MADPGVTENDPFASFSPNDRDSIRQQLIALRDSGSLNPSQTRGAANALNYPSLYRAPSPESPYTVPSNAAPYLREFAEAAKAKQAQPTEASPSVDGQSPYTPPSPTSPYTIPPDAAPYLKRFAETAKIAQAQGKSDYIPALQKETAAEGAADEYARSLAEPRGAFAEQVSKIKKGAENLGGSFQNTPLGPVIETAKKLSDVEIPRPVIRAIAPPLLFAHEFSKHVTEDSPPWLQVIAGVANIPETVTAGLLSPGNAALLAGMYATGGATGGELASRLIGAGFSGQLAGEAVNNIADGYAAAKSGNYREAASLFGSAVVSTALAALSGGHAVTEGIEPVARPAVKGPSRVPEVRQPAGAPIAPDRIEPVPEYVNLFKPLFEREGEAPAVARTEAKPQVTPAPAPVEATAASLFRPRPSGVSPEEIPPETALAEPNLPVFPIKPSELRGRALPVKGSSKSGAPETLPAVTAPAEEVPLESLFKPREAEGAPQEPVPAQPADRLALLKELNEKRRAAPEPLKVGSPAMLGEDLVTVRALATPKGGVQLAKVQLPNGEERFVNADVLAPPPVPMQRVAPGSALAPEGVAPGEKLPAGFQVEEPVTSEAVASGAEANRRRLTEAGFFDPSAFSDIGKNIRSVFQRLAESDAPTPRDISAGALREGLGGLIRQREVALKALDAQRQRFEGAPIPDSVDFIDRMERGQKQATAQNQDLADSLRDILDDAKDRVLELGNDKLKEVIENYFPHIWKRGQLPERIKASILGRRPLAGLASFLKPRTIDYTVDGIERGLRPVTYNPVELALLKVYEMDRFVMAHRVFNDLKTTGLAKMVPFGTRAPEGWKPLNDRMFFSPKGRWWAPEDAASVVNNHLSPGLRGYWQYDIFRQAGNTLNMAQLGLSAFHGIFTSVDSLTSDVALAIEHATSGLGHLGKGELGAAAKSFGKAGGLGLRASTIVGSPLSAYLRGSKVLKEYMSPGTYSKFSGLADAVGTAGGRVRIDPFYLNQPIDSFFKVWKEGRYAEGTLKAIPVALEAMAKPLMEHLVPRMKLGVFADLAEKALDDTRGQPKEVVRKALDDAWDSVDNRMGQLVYDNLFWNRAVKDMLMVLTRSLGWNIGTVREIGGGLKDFLQQGVNVAAGKAPKLTRRMAYTLALPIAAGWAGAVTNYLLTGEAPKSLKDYYYPRTGKKDAGGNDERISIPSYVKDVVGFARARVQTAQHKIHPLISSIAEMLENKDFYGNKIRNEDDPAVRQFADELKYVGKIFLPFSVRNAGQLGKESGEAGVKQYFSRESLPGYFGYTPAPRFIVRSPAEQRLSEYLGERAMAGGRTTEQANRAEEVRALEARLLNKTASLSDVSQAVREGKVGRTQAEDILKGLQAGPLVGRFTELTVPQALQVWSVATPDERQRLAPLLARKARSLANMSPEEMPDFTDRIRTALAEYPRSLRSFTLEYRKAVRASRRPLRFPRGLYAPPQTE